jgi:tetratricopeptide (TPR) repeat protein
MQSQLSAKYIIFLCLAQLQFFWPCGWAQDATATSDTSQLLDKGFKLRNEGRLDDVIRLMDEAISANPNCIDCYLLRSNALEAQGHFRDAARDARKLVALDAKSASFRARLGNYLARAGNYAEGIALCDQAIKLDPNCAEAFYHRATVNYLRHDRMQAALADAGKAARIDPHNGHYGTLYASILKEAGNKKQCDLEIKRVLEADKNFEPAWFLRGQIAWDEHRLESALQDWSLCCSLNPGDANAFASYGACLRKLKRFDAALKAYSKAIALNPELVCALDVRAGIYRDRGDNARSLADLKRATEVAQRLPSPPSVQEAILTDYCDTLLICKRLKDGIAVCSVCLHKKPLPDSLRKRLFRYRGQFYFILGNVSAASKDFQIASENDRISMGERYDTEYLLALDKQGQRRRAIDLGDKLLKLKPSDDILAKTLSSLKQQSGNLAGCLDDLNQLIALQPNDRELREDRLKLLIKMGHVQKALNEYDCLIRMHPSDSDKYRLKKIDLYERIGRDAEAVKEYSQLIKAQPQNAELLYSRADLYERLGGKDNARRDRKAADALLSR